MHRHLFAWALVFTAGPALAVDGLLDPSFGIFSTGRNLVALDQGGTNSDKLAGVLVGGDGSVFLVGTSAGNAGTSQYSITKMTPDGIIDGSFGVDGSVLSTFTSLVATSARFDNAGNILVAGSRGFGGEDRDFSVCRYNQSGAGVPFTALASNCLTVAFDVPGGNRTDVANDIIVEPNDKIVLAGIAGFSATRDFAAVARLLPDGTLDASFSGDGRSTAEPQVGQLNHFNAIARQADGKYIAVGETGDPAAVDGTAALFARLTTNGSLDPSYQNGDGYSRYALNIGDAFNRNESATSIRILGNGKMLMAGKAQVGSSNQKLIAFVFRINPSTITNIDPTFGTGGVAKIGAGFSYELGDLLVQSDGKIVLVGTNSPTSGSGRDMHVVRLLRDGDLDSDGFGNVGRINIDFVLPGELDFGVASALQSGRIIAAGHSLRVAPEGHDLTVAGLGNELIFADDFD